MASAFTYGLRQGWNPFESQSGYGSSQADNQIQQLLADQQEASRHVSPLSANWNYGALPAGNWGGGPQFSMPGGATPGTAGTGNTTGGLPLLQTPKSPSGNAALDSLLDAVRHLSNANNQEAFNTVRSPAQAGRTATAGSTLDTTNTGANQRLADFTANFFAAAPQAKGYLDQENQAIGEFYAPASEPTSVSATLARLANQRQQAVQGSLQRAQNQALRRTNLNRLGMGGNSSYANQQFMDTSAGILANEAAAEAELNRQNYLGVKDAQSRLAGTRAGLLNSYLTRDLTPITAGQQLLSSQLANLGTLGGITNANNITQTPEQLLGARLGLLGQYGQDLNGLNIFGVGGNFPSPALGWPNPRGGGGGGGYNPLLDIGNYTNPIVNARTGAVEDFGPGAKPTLFSEYRTPAAAGYVPNMPSDLANAPAPTRAAALRYYQQAGVWPTQDPNFSPELFNWALAQVNPAPNPTLPVQDPSLGYVDTGVGTGE